MNATFSEVRGDEVYVYVRGRLVMKRWLRTGISAVFAVGPAWTQWNHEVHRANSLHAARVDDRVNYDDDETT